MNEDDGVISGDVKDVDLERSELPFTFEGNLRKEMENMWIGIHIIAKGYNLQRYKEIFTTLGKRFGVSTNDDTLSLDEINKDFRNIIKEVSDGDFKFLSNNEITKDGRILLETIFTQRFQYELETGSDYFGGNITAYYNFDAIAYNSEAGEFVFDISQSEDGDANSMRKQISALEVNRVMSEARAVLNSIPSNGDINEMILNINKIGFRMYDPKPHFISGQKGGVEYFGPSPKQIINSRSVDILLKAVPSAVIAAYHKIENMNEPLKDVLLNSELFQEYFKLTQGFNSLKSYMDLLNNSIRRRVINDADMASLLEDIRFEGSTSPTEIVDAIKEELRSKVKIDDDWSTGMINYFEYLLK